MFYFITVFLTVVRSCWLRISHIFKQLKINDHYVVSTQICEHTTPHNNQKSHTISQNGSINDACIPRVKGLPIVGTMFELIAAGGAPRLHQYINRRHEQFGSIFVERLGSAFAPDAVFVASASLMRSVFFYEGQQPRHPIPDAWMLYNKKHNCQRGLFFMDGSEWLHNRRILNRFLLNGNLDWMNTHIDRCTDKLITSWRQQVCNSDNTLSDCYTIQNLEHQLYRWSIDVICSIMFGSMSLKPQHQHEPQHDDLEKKLDDFAHIVHTIFEHSSALMNFPTLVAKVLQLRMWRKFEKSVTDVLTKGGELIDALLEHNKCVENNADDDEEAKLHNKTLYNKLQHAGMSLAMIKRIFIDLVIAAGDTTAYTSEWTLYLLTQHPELQEQVAADVLGDKNWKDALIVRGLIRETLRLYPVAPFIGRYLATDAVIGGYAIKKNTLVLLSLYTAGRDSAHFPEPQIVRPQRWQFDEKTGQLEGVLNAHGTLPFAIGNRSCIGRRLAINQIQSLITAIVKNFELYRRNSNETFDCILRLVTVPSQSLQLVIKLRDQP